MNVCVREGDAELEIPSESLRRNSQTFFNPYMEKDRTLTCEILRVLEKKNVCDALCGSGVRAIRYALESGCESWANDSNPQAAELAEKNVSRNNLTIPVTCSDANVLLRQHKFDIVEIDPFGSPVPFLDSALCALHKNSFLFITATDTAALFSSASLACMRKYNVMPLKTDFSKELGVRILISKIMNQAFNHSLSLKVLFAYTHRHYIRLFLSVSKGKRKASGAFSEMGFVYSCLCGERKATKEILSSCPRCGGALSYSYPIYLGTLKENEFLEKLSDFWILGGIKNEIDVPLYFDLHTLSSVLKVTPPKSDDILSSLTENGFDCSRTHFCPTAIKTNAGLDDIFSLCRKGYK